MIPQTPQPRVKVPAFQAGYAELAVIEGWVIVRVWSPGASSSLGTGIPLEEAGGVVRALRDREPFNSGNLRIQAGMDGWAAVTVLSKGRAETVELSQDDAREVVEWLSPATARFGRTRTRKG